MGSILVLIVLLCACVSLCGACTCVPYNSPVQLCRYDLIFRGTITAEHKESHVDPDDPLPEYDFDSNWVYTVRVRLPIKMPENLQGNNTITMRTKTQSSLCGMRFSVNADDIIFAYINYEGNVTTGACDPSTRWAEMTDSFRELITEDLMDICSNQADVTPPEPYPH